MKPAWAHLRAGYEFRVAHSFAAGLGWSVNYLSIDRSIYKNGTYLSHHFMGIWYLNWSWGSRDLPQQIRGNCSPTGISTMRSAPSPVFMATSPGWSATTFPMISRLRPVFVVAHGL